MSWGALAAPGWRIRTGLVIMLIVSGCTLVVGLSHLLSGAIALGASIMLVSVACAWYAFDKGNKEARAQREYYDKCRERLESYIQEVHSRRSK